MRPAADLVIRVARHEHAPAPILTMPESLLSCPAATWRLPTACRRRSSHLDSVAEGEHTASATAE
jgi:hypothetical protein